MLKQRFQELSTSHYQARQILIHAYPRIRISIFIVSKSADMNTDLMSYPQINDTIRRVSIMMSSFDD